MARLSAAEYVTRVQAASEYIRSSLVSGGVCASLSSVSASLCVGVVLGSGLSDFTRLLHTPLLLDYANIPFMPQPAVSGHHGQLLIGRLPSPSPSAADSAATVAGDSSPLVLCFSGRVHSYEGHPSSSVCFMVRLCSALGVRCMLLTNSAGGCGAGMDEGSVMLIVDHLRSCALNAPLDCCSDERLGVAAIDCSSSPFVYSRSLHPLARSAAAVCGVELHEGVYQWSCGPTYESHAEVRAGMRQHVSAFGMSTVPEVMAAAALGLPTMALSLCTNLAAGLSDEKLTHEAVKAVANIAGPRFTRLVHHIVHTLHAHFHQLLHTHVTLPALEQPPSTTTVATATTSTASAGADAGVCRQLSLVPLVGWQPSFDELRAGARVLLNANVGHPPPVVVIQLPAAVTATSTTPHRTPLPTSLAPLLSSIRYVSLSDLPPIRQWPHSRTAVQGWLLLATERRSSTRLAILSSPAIEGLTASESSYIVQLLSLTGARALVQLADAVIAPSSVTSTSTPSSQPSFVSVCDVLDRSMDPPPLLALPSLTASLSAARSVFDVQLTECVERCISSAAAYTRGAVCSFHGPSFPTLAEQLTATQAGCIGVGVSSVAPLLVASRVGLLTAALWRLSPSAAESHSSDSDSSWSAVLAGVLSPIAAHVRAVTPELPAPPSIQQPCTDSLLSSLLPSSSASVTATAGRCPSWYVCEQESWSTVSTEAERLLSLLTPLTSGATAHRAVLLDASFDQRLPLDFHTVTTANFLWPTQQQRANSGWTVQLGVVRGQYCLEPPTPPLSSLQSSIHAGRALLSHCADPSLCVAGEPLLCARADSVGVVSVDCVLEGVVPLMRVLWKMGVRSVLLGFPASSLVAALPVGSIVTVTDHLNLTGLNPLFGHNEARYGPRFPDCSNLYTDVAAGTPSDLPAAVLASVSGWCDVNLPCERRWLLQLGAKLAVRGQVADAAIAARQMGMRTSAVAIVSCSTDDDSAHRSRAQWLPAAQLADDQTSLQRFFHAVEMFWRKSVLFESE